MTTVALVAFLAVALVPMLLEVWARRFDVFHPKNPFLLYLVVQIAVAWIATGMMETAALALSFHSPIAPLDHEAVFWCATAGVSAFQIAYYGSRGWEQRVKVPAEPRVSTRCLDWALVGAALAAAAGFALLLREAGGLEAFVQNREAWRTEGLTGQGPVSFACTTAPVMVAMVYWASRPWGQKPLGVAGAMALVGTALIPSFIIGFRSLMLLPVVQLLVLLVHAGMTARRTLLVTGALVGALFTAYGVYREWNEMVPDNAALLEGAELMFEKRPELFFNALIRVRGADVVAVVMRDVDHSQPYKLVLPSLVEAATIPIPRSVWPGKGLPLSIEFSERFFGLSGGMPPTIIGEFYWHLGWIGVILGMAVWGVLARVLLAFWRALPSRSHWLVLYSFAFVNFVMSAEIIQGYLNAMVLQGIAFAGLTAILRWCRGRRDADEAQGTVGGGG